jgi:chaperonin GroEL
MKLAKQLIEREELHQRIAKGARKAYLLAKAGYGPLAGTALLEQPMGDPLLSRDGITNSRNYFDPDPVQNMAIRTMVQASAQSNRIAGDGTTAAILLAYHLYSEARKLVAAGYNPMDVSHSMQDAAAIVQEQLDKLAKPFNEDLLKKVAEISSGSEAIGNMLTDIFTTLGLDGHILVEMTDNDIIESEIIQGFFFPKGFSHISLINDPSNLESRHFEVPILISDKPLRTVPDIAPLLQKTKEAGRNELIIVSEVGQEALDVIALNRMNGRMTVLPIEPMYYEGLRTLFLKDLALATGGKVFNGSPDSFNAKEYLGFASKVVVNGRSTTIVGADGIPEDIDKVVLELKTQLDKAKNETDINMIRERLGRLQGKFAMIRVGAPTEIERREAKLRVDDSVSAVQAAPKYGVLPGGGVALARVEAGRFTVAYKRLLCELADNGGLNPERLLDAVERARPWYGFDLKHMTEKPVDLLKAGIVDPAMVIKEVVKNATSVASTLITANVGLVLNDRDEKSN